MITLEIDAVFIHVLEIINMHQFFLIEFRDLLMIGYLKTERHQSDCCCGAARYDYAQDCCKYSENLKCYVYLLLFLLFYSPDNIQNDSGNQDDNSHDRNQEQYHHQKHRHKSHKTTSILLSYSSKRAAQNTSDSPYYIQLKVLLLYFDLCILGILLNGCNALKAAVKLGIAFASSDDLTVLSL